VAKDGADLHVERWRDHWVLDQAFDDDIEAMTVRIGTIQKWFRTTSKAAVATVGLQDFEYETLHALMIRDTPGRASPGELAREMGLSNAGVTGRLDSMEKKGWLKRIPGVADRRRVEVEATREGLRLWRAAMTLRGSAEHDVGTALSKQELATLNKLLKKMTLYIERAVDREERAGDVGERRSSKPRG
jgi:DNA-binding MarR family transcriptional regulator